MIVNCNNKKSMNKAKTRKKKKSAQTFLTSLTHVSLAQRKFNPSSSCTDHQVSNCTEGSPRGCPAGTVSGGPETTADPYPATWNSWSGILKSIHNTSKSVGRNVTSLCLFSFISCQYQKVHLCCKPPHLHTLSSDISPILWLLPEKGVQSL